MKKIPFVLYAGDSEQEGTRCGIETIRRSNRAIDFINLNTSKCLAIILGAGIRPDKPNYPPLKKVMKNFLEEKLPIFPIITVEKDGWGTFRESLAIYDGLQKCNENEIYVCSSWYHLPRIRLIWFIISEGKVKIKSVSAPSPRLSSIPKEMLSFIKVFLDWYKWKRSR